MRKYNWKKILTRGLWLLTGAGAIVLLGAAIQKKDQKKCTDTNVEIAGAEKHMFIDEKDVLAMINIAGRAEGSRLSALRLRTMETRVEKNPWVKNAEMYVDNRRVLQVKIEERQPVARVFTTNGYSFYVDSSAMRLPLSEKISARVPVFTGFPSDKPVLSKPDSMLLRHVVHIGRYILSDSFWMAQASQIDITPQAYFEMVPLMGDHIVMMGNADDIENKFKKLYTFYTKAWVQNGINTYEKLDIRYHNQIVAIRKGITKTGIDSARVQEIMDAMQIGQPNESAVVHPYTTTVVKTVKGISKGKMIGATSRVQPAKQKLDKAVNNNKTSVNTLSNEKKKQAEKRPKAVLKKS